ncbi:MAG: phosphoglucosamine mutase [Candidatus Altiarchaeales archaeon ex4484_96]|nr:MAG: phosphoglucosamine mutase [Candidatus Altiarchaeales archaeon ex4484_96]
MDEKIFGTSGVRRLVEDMPKAFILSLAAALAAASKDEFIAVGADPRKSSPEIKQSFILGLINCGKKVVDLGMVPTPTTAMASEQYGTSVMITASHNPPEYNGFKFWAEGRAFTPEQEKHIERLFFSGKTNEAEIKDTKTIKVDYLPKHESRILKALGGVDMKVDILVDCANGAGCVITPRLLEKMGCSVTGINTRTDGVFAHGLEPTRENLAEVCDMVREAGVDVAVAHDGDADRTAAIDADGKLVDWDSFLSVLAYGKDKVVTTVDASMRIEEVCGQVIRTPVGDVHVANAVEKYKADFGGEPSGSFIYPSVHLFPDGVYTAALTAKMVSENRFYEILDLIKEYPTSRLKLPCAESDKKRIMDLVSHKASKLDYELNTIDGVRLSSDEGWFLIRPSGTESFIRITAEAQTKKQLNSLLKVGRELVEMSSTR